MTQQKRFSKYRLNGEAVPADVAVLLNHSDELAARTSVLLHWEADWSPWLDTGYLTDEDRANSDIAANVKAGEEVCKYITFVANDDDSQYFGYWRGLEQLSLEAAPLVLLDNEGQFRLYGATSFAAAVLAETHFWYGQKEGELEAWMVSIGVPLSLGSNRFTTLSPGQLHTELYYRYLGKPMP